MSDHKLEYGTAAEIDITLANLAQSTTHTSGQESDAVSNESLKMLDELITGKIKVGTSPTVGKVIKIWAYAENDATPGYPDDVTGSDGTLAMTSENVRNHSLRLLETIVVDSTTDRVYYFGPVSLAAIFGRVPPTWGIVVTHDLGSGVTLNATEADSKIWHQPVYASTT